MFCISFNNRYSFYLIFSLRESKIFVLYAADFHSFLLLICSSDCQCIFCSALTLFFNYFALLDRFGSDLYFFLLRFKILLWLWSQFEMIYYERDRNRSKSNRKFWIQNFYFSGTNSVKLLPWCGYEDLLLGRANRIPGRGSCTQPINQSGTFETTLILIAIKKRFKTTLILIATGVKG